MAHCPANGNERRVMRKKQHKAGKTALAAALICCALALFTAVSRPPARAIELPDDVFYTPSPSPAPSADEDELPVIGDETAPDTGEATGAPGGEADATAASADVQEETPDIRETADPDATPVPTYNGNVIKFEVPEEGGKKNTSSAGGVIMLIIIGLALISVVTGIVEKIIKAVRHRNDNFKVD